MAKAASCDNSDANAISLIKFLKQNPPEESYENPKLPGEVASEGYKQFLIDMFFGNYTEFIEHVDGLSKDEIDKALNKREGFCQQSPIFAPILGLRLADLDDWTDFTSKDRKEIKAMYSLNNENRHYNILNKLIELGADVDAHDIHGFTALHFACLHGRDDMATLLLDHGADPNAESWNGVRPLELFTWVLGKQAFNMIQILLRYNGKLTYKKSINDLRSNVELQGCKHIAARAREAHPRDKEECEKCVKPAVKKCGACGLVYYCTPACQKMDWKSHKVTCKKGKTKLTENCTFSFH